MRQNIMVAAPALIIERDRMLARGIEFLGICPNPDHTYGYHLTPAQLRARGLYNDYSLRGTLNIPVGDHCCALDVGMEWDGSRVWLRELLDAIADDRVQGVAEVIGSVDGKTVRYWTDAVGWTGGQPYTGSGHLKWTHIGIYRSTALQDHKLMIPPRTDNNSEEDMGDIDYSIALKLYPDDAVSMRTTLSAEQALGILTMRTLVLERNLSTLVATVNALTAAVAALAEQVEPAEPV